MSSSPLHPSHASVKLQSRLHRSLNEMAQNLSPTTAAPLDQRWMRRALSLAARSHGKTAPNPMVGAVLVKKGQVVGEGYHHVAGGPHAEVLALRAAGSAARG